jgi:hypothetical protein
MPGNAAAAFCAGAFGKWQAHQDHGTSGTLLACGEGSGEAVEGDGLAAQGAGAEDDGGHDLQLVQDLVRGHPGARALGSVLSMVAKARRHGCVGTNLWSASPGQGSQLLCMNAFVLRILGDDLAEPDYRADPRTIVSCHRSPPSGLRHSWAKSSRGQPARAGQQPILATTCSPR